MSQFYLQDSRSHVGDGLTFWALGGGYTTNLDKAELFTAEQATRHRDPDIPWPKSYIDERAHLGVDHQYISEADSAAQPTEGCQCVLQIQQQWNGNDILFAKWPIGGTDRLPAPISDAAHIRVNDAFCRRASDVGCAANGSQRLDDDRSGIRQMDAFGR